MGTAKSEKGQLFMVELFSDELREKEASAALQIY